MSTTITVLHVRGQGPTEVERALDAIFAREERPRVLRIEGTYSAVLARATDPDLAAGYRYVVLRPHAESVWTPLLELGNRTDGLDVELSRALDGCVVVTAFEYGEALAGYRVARDGALVDRYVSDPTVLADEGAAVGEASGAGEGEGALPDVEVAELAGHPERFADLLPIATAPEDFARVVLRPGWWEEREAEQGIGAGADEPDGLHDSRDDGAGTDEDEDEDEDVVDEVDRMRCIGLALELWGPSEYPFAQEPEEIPNQVAGPAIAMAFA
jgi:hypothetical protein